jgi:thiol-disulfide isomerase/thioredoxin
MRPLGLVAVAMAALLLTACGASDADTGTAFVAGDGSIVLIAPDERQPAPDLVGPTLEGGEFRLSDHLGDVVVLNVWASWCAPCRAEAPVLEDVWREVKDDGYGVTYPNVIDTDGRLQLLFSDTLPPQAIPSTLVVDREGRVAGRILGRVTDATLTALIDDVAR